MIMITRSVGIGGLLALFAIIYIDRTNQRGEPPPFVGPTQPLQPMSNASVYLHPNGAMTFGPTTSPGRFFVGKTTVDQPLKADRAFATESDAHAARAKIEIEVRGEKFTLYADNIEEARRFLKRAVDAQSVLTVSGRLTWEGK